MKAVELVWTPSTSAGVDSQTAKIVNADTAEVYGEAVLDPDANGFLAQCPEGVTVQGVVITTRGTQNATAVSETLFVPYGPLEAATGLALSIAPQVPT